MILDSLIPDTFFMSWFAILFLLIIYLPITYVVLVWVWDRLTMSREWNLVVILSLLFVAIAMPLGDVYLGSLQLEKRCKEDAGLNVYKTVEVDGFYSKYLHFSAATDGYYYIESKYRGKLYRVFSRDGKVFKEEIRVPQSRYVLDYENHVLNSSLGKSRYFILDRWTNETLGEWADYFYYGGWLDRYLFLSWLDYRPTGCSKKPFVLTDFYLNVLIPLKFNLEEKI